MVDLKITNLVDEIYLMVYGTIFIVAFLLLLGYQDIISNHIPQWELWYDVFQVLLMVLSLIGIFLNIVKQRQRGYYYIIVLTTIFGVNASLQLFILLSSHIDGGIIFRTVVNVVFTVILIYRFRLIREYIKEGL